MLAINGGRPIRTAPYVWPIHEGYERELLLEVLESGVWSFNGPMQTRLEEELQSYLNVDFAYLVNSGTSALEIAIRALGIGPGDEVVIPALTWNAPAWAVVASGGTVVFADIDESDWCIDPEAISDSITDRTKAIIIVHSYGNACDVDRIHEIGADHELPVIEDCAHAIGSSWRGCALGSQFSIGCFSFQQSKLMTSGEGGLVATSDPELAEKLFNLKNCGRGPSWGSPGIGGNSRPTEMQAAILLGQLSRLDQQRDDRQEYLGELEARLSGQSLLTMCLPDREHQTDHNFYAVPLLLSPDAGVENNRFTAALNSEGIPAYQPHPVVYQSTIWRGGADVKFGYQESALHLNADCPVAEGIANRQGVVLPHYIFLEPRERAGEVVSAIEKVLTFADQIPKTDEEFRGV